jgi:hypothetical protein
MPLSSWKTFVSALALASSATACAHHNDGEVVPEHERAELLKKWDQEVCLHVQWLECHSDTEIDV